MEHNIIYLKQLGFLLCVYTIFTKNITYKNMNIPILILLLMLLFPPSFEYVNNIVVYISILFNTLLIIYLIFIVFGKYKQ